MLKWRFQSRDESLVPLTINAWPSASGAETYVNIEYESGASFDLRHVVIAIPLPHMGHAPAVNQVRAQRGRRTAAAPPPCAAMALAWWPAFIPPPASAVCPPSFAASSQSAQP